MSGETKQVHLKELNIEYHEWGENKDHYTGKVTYNGANGSITLVLSPKISEELLLFLAPLLSKHSATVATEVSRQIVEQVISSRQPVIEETSQS